MSRQEASEYLPFFSFCTKDVEGVYVWRVDFYTQVVMDSDYLDGYIVWISPEDGTVLEFWEPGGNG